MDVFSVDVAYFTIEETAVMLRCDPGTVRRWIREGRVKARVARIGNGKVRRVIGHSEFADLFEDVCSLPENLRADDSRARVLAYRERLAEARRKATAQRMANKARASQTDDPDPSTD